MPSKYYRRVFIKGYYYHIYNRGANKEVVLKDSDDYQTFIEILAYYLTFPKGKPLSILKNMNNQNKLKFKVPNLNGEGSTLKLCAFCLMPNHFHLLLKQQNDPTKENSFSNLMRRITITYAMYFQKKYEHSGTLFQGKFKNVLIDSDNQLIQLSKYIHRNPLETTGSEPLINYKFSSYRYFTGAEDCPDWLDTKDILSFFSKTSPNAAYQRFVEEKSKDIENESIEKLRLE